MPKIVERERRKPSGLFEYPVVMGDGQTWWLPKPRARFSPAAGESGIKAVIRFSGEANDDYQSLLDAWREASQDESEGSFARWIAAELRLASALFALNYDLTPEELPDILQFAYDEDDEEGRRIRDEVIACASGRAPKVPGGTSV